MKKVLCNIKKVFGIAIGVLIAALCIAAVLTSLLNKERNRPNFLFDRSVLWVETGSMEPYIPERSYILVKKSDGSDIDVGDVITFVCNDSTSPVYGSLVTHRVTDIVDGGFRTQGDNSNPDTWVVSNSDVVAVHTKNLPIFTVIGRIFASPVGLILIVGLFLFSCAFIYIPDIVRTLKSESEEERERLIEERVREEVKKMQEQDKNEVSK